MQSKVLGWLSFAVITGMYVYMVIAAIGNLTQFPVMAEQMGLGVNATGWFWLCFGVVLPIVGYGAALWIGRRRTGGVRLLVLVAALAAVAAVQLEATLLVPPVSFFM